MKAIYKHKPSGDLFAIETDDIGKVIAACGPLFGKDFDPKYELLPIPQSFIEANTDNVIEQNPGY